MSKDAQIEFASDPPPRDKGGADDVGGSVHKKGHWTYNEDTGIFIWAEHDTQHSLVDLGAYPNESAGLVAKASSHSGGHHPQDKSLDDAPQASN